VSKAAQAWFFSHLLLFTTRFWGIAVATIEDLAFPSNPLRESNGVIKKIAEGFGG
jgi:hypothetical protein